MIKTNNQFLEVSFLILCNCEEMAKCAILFITFGSLKFYFYRCFLAVLYIHTLFTCTTSLYRAIGYKHSLKAYCMLYENLYVDAQFIILLCIHLHVYLS